MRDVIIVLPGILGSTLQKSGKDVWAPSAGAVIRGLIGGNAGVEGLVLKDDPADVDNLGDGVVVTGLFPDAHLIPGLWKIDGYTRVTRYIRQVFDVTEGANYFEFPYDWRRDNRVAARRLAAQARQWLAQWRAKQSKDARLILVAHSMGGLISRYFLEVLEGWRDTRALVTFGTPYRGSLNALNMLAGGMRAKIGPFGADLTAVVRSLTSVYQLLPIYPCYDPGDGHLIRIAEATKLPQGVDPAKVRDALKFHDEIRNQVATHESDSEYREKRYRIFPLVGTHQETLQSAVLGGDGSLEVVPEYEGRDLDGDGTVPRVSATPIELSHEQREFFVAQKHGSLQNADASCVQLEGILKSTQLNLAIFKAPTRTENRLRLAIEDSYQAGEPITIRARPEAPLETLDASIANVDTNDTHTRQLMFRSNGWAEGEPLSLKPGTYRVSVSGRRPVVPISDLFVVV
jgi:pimeloyl-ACP methyl ester carboxylesterase